MQSTSIATTCQGCGAPLQNADDYCLQCHEKPQATDVAIPIGEAAQADEQPVEEMPGKSSEQEATPDAPVLIEVRQADGESTAYEIAQLKEAILNGSVSRAQEARIGEKGEWTSVERIAEGVYDLKVLYKPLWAHIGSGLQYGALIGIGLKLLETNISLFIANPAGLAGIAFLLVVGSILLGKVWSMAPFLGGFLAFKFGFGFSLYAMLFGAAVAGAIFGAPLGALIGSIIGHFRKNRLPKAPDSEAEGANPYWWGMLAPAVFLAAAVPLYIFWFIPKVSEWALQQN